MKIIKKLSKWFYRSTNIWLVLLFFLLQISFTFYLFPIMLEMIGNGMQVEVLDTQFGFTTSRAVDILDTMGQAGRGFYENTVLFIDGIFPVVYILFLMFLISLIFKNLRIRNKKRYLVNLLPLIIGLFDYLENMGIITLINQYPHLSDTTVLLTSMANLMKWGSIFLIVLLIVLGGIGLLTKRYRYA